MRREEPIIRYLGSEPYDPAAIARDWLHNIQAHNAKMSATGQFRRMRTINYKIDAYPEGITELFSSERYREKFFKAIMDERARIQAPTPSISSTPNTMASPTASPTKYYHTYGQRIREKVKFNHTVKSSARSEKCRDKYKGNEAKIAERRQKDREAKAKKREEMSKVGKDLAKAKAAEGMKRLRAARKAAAYPKKKKTEDVGHTLSSKKRQRTG
jgi:hypothetical protein